MKKSIVFATIIMLYTATNLMGQMIVKSKPQRPNVVIVKPNNKAYKNKVWIEGHWNWSKRSQNYQWIKGHWVKRRTNSRWVVGKWAKVQSGWKYVPGRWIRR